MKGRFFGLMILVLWSVVAQADGYIRILKWHTDKEGLIQTYNADGTRNGVPVSPPDIPKDGLLAIRVGTLGDVYLVQVGDTVLYVRDRAIGEDKPAEPPRTCNSQAPPRDSGERRPVGVSVQCP